MQFYATYNHIQYFQSIHTRSITHFHCMQGIVCKKRVHLRRVHLLKNCVRFAVAPRKRRKWPTNHVQPLTTTNDQMPRQVPICRATSSWTLVDNSNWKQTLKLPGSCSCSWCWQRKRKRNPEQLQQLPGEREIKNVH